ncbi:hypothetical protein ARSEF4850_010083 [Beauveria asiatica]
MVQAPAAIHQSRNVGTRHSTSWHAAVQHVARLSCRGPPVSPGSGGDHASLVGLWGIIIGALRVCLRGTWVSLNEQRMSTASDDRPCPTTTNAAAAVDERTQPWKQMKEVQNLFEPDALAEHRKGGEEEPLKRTVRPNSATTNIANVKQ